MSTLSKVAQIDLGLHAEPLFLVDHREAQAGEDGVTPGKRRVLTTSRLLAREYRGRFDEYRLSAGEHSGSQCPQRHLGLAKAHVTAGQAVH